MKKVIILFGLLFILNSIHASDHYVVPLKSNLQSQTTSSFRSSTPEKINWRIYTVTIGTITIWVVDDDGCHGVYEYGYWTTDAHGNQVWNGTRADCLCQDCECSC